MSGDAKNLILDRGNGTTCTVNLHGATITSWKVSEVEQLFVSKKAIFDDKTPILGGIPIVFPHFADWEEKPFHGFARVCRWLVEKPPKKSENGDVSAVLKLMDTAWTRQFWDYTFTLTLEVVLGRNHLVTDISVHNPSPKQSFAFDLLLHTYFLLPDVSKCEITGFKGCSYVDKTQNFQEFTQKSDVITVRKYTDNIYKDTAEEHVISNASGGKSIKLVKSNYPDTVVWNPWSDTVKNFPDLDESEFPHFFCVEAGNVAKPVLLAPGQTFKASQILYVIDN
uniref:glucose-6-phosphate 1-epimerase n=1 Tax=Lygus hesperus TaxID=30085 RepID=A0A146LRR1_LYGHE